MDTDAAGSRYIYTYIYIYMSCYVTYAGACIAGVKQAVAND